MINVKELKKDLQKACKKIREENRKRLLENGVEEKDLRRYVTNDYPKSMMTGQQINNNTCSINCRGYEAHTVSAMLSYEEIEELREKYSLTYRLEKTQDGDNMIRFYYNQGVEYMKKFLLIFVSLLFLSSCDNKKCDMYLHTFTDIATGKNYGVDNIYLYDRCGVDFNNYKCLTNVKHERIWFVYDSDSGLVGYAMAYMENDEPFVISSLYIKDK